MRMDLTRMWDVISYSAIIFLLDTLRIWKMYKNSIDKFLKKINIHHDQYPNKNICLSWIGLIRNFSLAYHIVFDLAIVIYVFLLTL